MSAPQLTIYPAVHGGFVVMEERERGMFSPFMFAGSLTDSLEYMRSRLAEPAKPSAQASGGAA